MKKYKITIQPEPNQIDRHTLRFNGSNGRTMDDKGILNLQKLINDYVIVNDVKHPEK